MILSIKEQLIRIGVAFIVGLLIGVQRQKSNKAAGIKTHSLITVVCTMLTMVSVYGFNEFNFNMDPTRLLSNILTGVGFLSGGVIYVSSKKGDDEHEEETVFGLTTAAGIFGTAMMGIPIGLGYYPIVIITTIAIELSLNFNKITRKFDE